MIEITKFPKKMRPKRVHHIFDTELRIRCKCSTCKSELLITDIMDITHLGWEIGEINSAYYECPNCKLDDPECESRELVGYFGVRKIRKYLNKIVEGPKITELLSMSLKYDTKVLDYDIDVYKAITILLEIGRLSFDFMMPKYIVNHPRYKEIFDAIENGKLPYEFDEIAWLKYDATVNEDTTVNEDDEQFENQSRIGSLIGSVREKINNGIGRNTKDDQHDEIEAFVIEHERHVQNIVHEGIKQAGREWWRV